MASLYSDKGKFYSDLSAAGNVNMSECALNQKNLQKTLNHRVPGSSPGAPTTQSFRTGPGPVAEIPAQTAYSDSTCKPTVKVPTKLMELQSEYAKSSYETFVAEAKRISELYADLFKQTTKPLEDLIAKNKAA